MIRFDDVLPETVRVVESSPLAGNLKSVTVIRDLRGRIRLVFEFPKDPTDLKGERELLPTNWEVDERALKNNLATTLGPYWGGQIWRAGARNDTAFQAMREAIETHRQLWYPPSGFGKVRWYKLERQFSKSSWRPGSIQPPWALDDPNTPAIVSFYSFKGGVGRTTAVAAIALLLAQAGKRTLVFDLDLEAPGVGNLLLENITPPEDGIVDYLVEL